MPLPAPSYLNALQDGTLERRAKRGIEALSHCNLCPRRCAIDRTAGDTGFCKTGDRAVVASYNAHFGEETPLVGRNGSGTIFFSHCNLLCNFCQNFDISHQGLGRPVSDAELADIIDAGIAFRTSGCPGKVQDDISACDRPYGDSPPSDIASYPFQPKKKDLRKIRKQLDIPVRVE